MFLYYVKVFSFMSSKFAKKDKVKNINQFAYYFLDKESKIR